MGAKHCLGESGATAGVCAISVPSGRGGANNSVDKRSVSMATDRATSAVKQFF